jgi:hypothetical protein
MTDHEFQLKKIALIAKCIMSSALLLIGVAAIIYSAQPAQAYDFPQTLDDSGKYRLQYTTGLESNGNFYWHMLAYNTETGKMKLYYWDMSSQGWTENFSGKNLPELP